MAENIAPIIDLTQAGAGDSTWLPLAIKRGLDIGLGTALALVALPCMLAIAAAIRIDTRGPALFRARRIGRNGHPFTMLKFRTMVNGAHERLPELAHLNVAQGMVKIPDDPRVTRVGKWLRRFSLDELPQIFNVITGRMSLVGPRPHDTRDLLEQGLDGDQRFSVRPGLTGLWQVNARSNPRLSTRIRLDNEYLSAWSLLLDLKILLKTIPVVIRGRGGHVECQSTRGALDEA